MYFFSLSLAFDFIELKYNNQVGRVFTFTDRVQSPVDNNQIDGRTRNNVDLERSVLRNSSARCVPLDNVTECDK